jgi:hypothetical protein
MAEYWKTAPSDDERTDRIENEELRGRADEEDADFEEDEEFDEDEADADEESSTF